MTVFNLTSQQAIDSDMKSFDISTDIFTCRLLDLDLLNDRQPSLSLIYGKNRESCKTPISVKPRKAKPCLTPSLPKQLQNHAQIQSQQGLRRIRRKPILFT